MKYDVSDNELIYLYKSNSNEALELLTNRYKKRIYGLIDKIKVKSNIKVLDYEEYYHDCYWAFIKCIGMFDDTYMFYSYVMKAMENVILRLILKEKRNNEIMSLEYELIDSGYSYESTINDSVYLYEESTLKDYIKDNFDEISIKIIEARMEGYNCEEIKAKFKISNKVIYNRLNKIKSVLKNNPYH